MLDALNFATFLKTDQKLAVSFCKKLLGFKISALLHDNNFWHNSVALYKPFHVILPWTYDDSVFFCIVPSLSHRLARPGCRFLGNNTAWRGKFTLRSSDFFGWNYKKTSTRSVFYTHYLCFLFLPTVYTILAHFMSVQESGNQGWWQQWSFPALYLWTWRDSAAKNEQQGRWYRCYLLASGRRDVSK